MANRFKLDENLPRDAETLLRDAGHDVATVLSERLGGSSDSRLFNICQAESRVLITLDLDFADIRQYPPSNQAGICILRPPAQSIGNTVTLLRSVLHMFEREPIVNRLWIVEPGRIRIRE
ncbi:MAG: DUF5615 family PIN-like protein [Gammaproteobacteria bacterium]